MSTTHYSTPQLTTRRPRRPRPKRQGGAPAELRQLPCDGGCRKPGDQSNLPIAITSEDGRPAAHPHYNWNGCTRHGAFQLWNLMSQWPQTFQVWRGPKSRYKQDCYDAIIRKDGRFCDPDAWVGLCFMNQDGNEEYVVLAGFKAGDGIFLSHGDKLMLAIDLMDPSRGKPMKRFLRGERRNTICLSKLVDKSLSADYQEQAIEGYLAAIRRQAGEQWDRLADQGYYIGARGRFVDNAATAFLEHLQQAKQVAGKGELDEVERRFHLKEYLEKMAKAGIERWRAANPEAAAEIDDDWSTESAVPEELTVPASLAPEVVSRLPANPESDPESAGKWWGMKDILAEYEAWARRYNKAERALSPAARLLRPQIVNLIKIEQEAVPIVNGLRRKLRDESEDDWKTSACECQELFAHDAA